MEQRPNQSAGPRDYSGLMRGYRLCTRQCCLRSGPVGFENKCGRVGLGTNFIGSVSGRVYLLKNIYARWVRVRSNSGRVQILGPEKTSSSHTTLWFLSPWQHQSCHSIHHRGNTRAVTQYITMTTPELSLNTSPWQHQSCHSIHHHDNTRAVTQYITMATPELSLNTSPWQHQSCHSIHQKHSNWS